MTLNHRRSRAEILVVDDTPANLKLLINILRENGYKVRPVPDGILAIEAVRKSQPDLILLDILMPNVDGYEVCKQLKSDPNTANIPIIFLSALSEGLDKAKAFQVGGADYITKPFQVEEALARVNYQLTLRSLQAQLQEKNQQLTEQNSRLKKEIRDRRQAEMEIRLLLATSQAIHRAPDLHAAFNHILSMICQSLQWDLAETWIPNADGTILECSEGCYLKDASLSDYRQKSKPLTFAPGEGIPGRIWLSKRPEWIENLAEVDGAAFMRAEIAAKAGLKAAFGVPILADEKVLAIWIFYQKQASAYQSRMVELVQTVATQLGALVQRKQAEDALRIAEQRYHSIVENAIDGIFQSTPEGRYLSVNPALARIYGYGSPEALMLAMKNINDQLYVDPKRRQEFIAAIEVDGAVSGFESLIYRQDGTQIWISENARAVRDSTGRLLYYEGTVSDITERKLAQQALELQKAQTERLLLNILPQSIATRLKAGETPIADQFEQVSVLFADLVGFTNFSAQQTPAELVEILNAIFSEFDRLAEKHRLEKIKTIGDAYMVVGGLPVPRADYDEAIAQMALDMLASINRLNVNTNKAFQVRIGINIGTVIAGVIGKSKFIYDLWGDTVNIASRMESSGVPGKIQVSATTYECLKEQFSFEERGIIEVKGKGEMLTYWLKGRR
jgi:adenylate cyclase